RPGPLAVPPSEGRLAGRAAQAGGSRVGHRYRAARTQAPRIRAAADSRAALAAPQLLPLAAQAQLGAIEPARQAGRFLRDERKADREDRDARPGHGEEERTDECQDNPGGDEHAALPRAGAFAVHAAVALLEAAPRLAVDDFDHDGVFSKPRAMMSRMDHSPPGGGTVLALYCLRPHECSRIAAFPDP